MAALLLKYAPYGQPRMQRFRYWQPPRPLCGCVRFATRPMIIGRPSKLLAMRSFTCRSRQFISIGGRNWPSGNCGRPSRLPLIPAKRST